MINLLNNHYYFNSDGKIDQFTKKMSCADVCKYFIIKANGTIFEESPFYLFIRDITFTLTVNNVGRIHNINFIDNKLDNYYCKANFNKSNTEEILQKIDSLIEQNQPVLIQTDIYRTPFTKQFKSYDAVPSNPGHVFFIVGTDENNFYYVEAPWTINYQSFKQYKDNKSIGIIEKKQLIPAFNAYVNYITLDIDIEKAKFNSTAIKDYISNIQSNFYLESSNNTDESVTYYGSYAYEKLISILESGTYKLNDLMLYLDIELYEFLSWKSWEIIHGREMLEGLIAQLNETEIQQKILKVIKKLTSYWKMISSSAEIRYRRKKYEIDDDLINYFKAAYKDEKLLIELLGELAKMDLKLHNI